MRCTHCALPRSNCPTLSNQNRNQGKRHRVLVGAIFLRQDHPLIGCDSEPPLASLSHRGDRRLTGRPKEMR
jgi:hypothetical protein